MPTCRRHAHDQSSDPTVVWPRAVLCDHTHAKCHESNVANVFAAKVTFVFVGVDRAGSVLAIAVFFCCPFIAQLATVGPVAVWVALVVLAASNVVCTGLTFLSSERIATNLVLLADSQRVNCP